MGGSSPPLPSQLLHNWGLEPIESVSEVSWMPKRMATMEGTLLRYGSGSCHVAFTSGKHLRHVLVVGGLTDGLMATRYVGPLAAAVDRCGWCLTQTLLSSSHHGYGTSSLDRDAEELSMLLHHLRKERMANEVVVVGHSTGCQDAVRLAAVAVGDGRPDGLVLQAPVSDRECFEQREDAQEFLQLARERMEQGEEEAIMPREADACGAPMTAKRFLSLYDKGGDDDMFSSDLTDEELEERLGHLDDLPTLMVLSEKDEFVKPGLDAAEHGARLASAAGRRSRAEVIQGGDHSLKDHTRNLVDVVVRWLNWHFP